jgi:hypothetical protein
MSKFFSCPDVHLPKDLNSNQPFKKRKRDDKTDMSNSKISNPKSKSGMSKQEMRTMMFKVKEFSSSNNEHASSSTTSTVRKPKVDYRSDLLTQLGAPPVKQKKMPFKMKMNILSKRAERQKRVESERVESGVVVATSKSSSGQKKRKK